MNKLITKKSLGQLDLVYPDKENNSELIDAFSIGEGRFSLSKKEDFFLLNFWARAEYECKTPDEKNVLVWGPTFEVLTKIEKNFDFEVSR